MEKKIGYDRIVFVMPKLGIVIKVPKIKLQTALRIFVHDLKMAGLRNTIKFQSGLDITIRDGILNKLFGGIAANILERRFYKRTHHPFVQPTFCSLGGLLNVQEYGEPCEPDLDVWGQLLDITERGVFKDRHHFQNQANFCYRDEWLSMNDYGQRAVQEVIEKYGLAILARFDRTKKEKWR